jgi:hypothetical protein
MKNFTKDFGLMTSGICSYNKTFYNLVNHTTALLPESYNKEKCAYYLEKSFRQYNVVY